MNKELKYLYPITRVGSIVNQLRTTAHSAFLVVTPLALDKVQHKPQTMAKHTPQLYSTRERYMSMTESGSIQCIENRPYAIPSLPPSLLIDIIDRDDEIPSPIPDDGDALLSPDAATSINQHTSHPVHSHQYPTIPEEDDHRDDMLNSLTVTLTLPEHSRGRGIQSLYRSQDDQRVLVFHGIILRSQLVTLLEHKIFFNEKDGVS